MSVIDSIKGFLLGEEDEGEYQPIYEDVAQTVDVAEERRNREVKIATTATVQIVLARPTDFSEVKSIGRSQQSENRSFEPRTGQVGRRQANYGLPFRCCLCQRRYHQDDRAEDFCHYAQERRLQRRRPDERARKQRIQLLNRCRIPQSL